MSSVSSQPFKRSEAGLSHWFEPTMTGPILWQAYEGSSLIFALVGGAPAPGSAFWSCFVSLPVWNRMSVAFQHPLPGGATLRLFLFSQMISVCSSIVYVSHVSGLLARVKCVFRIEYDDIALWCLPYSPVATIQIQCRSSVS